MYSTYQFVQNHLKTILHPLELMLLHRLIRLQYQKIISATCKIIRDKLSTSGLYAFFAIEALSALEFITPLTPFKLNFPNKIYLAMMNALVKIEIR